MELSYQDTTRTLGWLPLLASSPLPPTRVRPVGPSQLGGVLCFDPFELYRVGYLTSPNLLVLGEIGRGKSAFVKTLLVREPSATSSILILDPKGEYQSAAEVLGAHRLTLAEGTGLDPFAGVDGSRRILGGVMVSLFRVLYDRSPLPLEYRLLHELVDALLDAPASITLGRLVELVEVHRSGAHVDPESIRLRRELHAQLMRLIDGDLAGIFGVTGAGVALERRVVVDLRSLGDRRLTGFAISCLLRARIAQFARSEVGSGFVVIDEAWSVLQHSDSVREMRELFKLARSYGASVIAVTHRLSDLDAESAELVKDVETRVIFRQPREELDHIATMLGLPRALTECIATLGRGEALWSIGTHQFLVTHRLIDGEHELVDTDRAMRA
ncbi:MAG: ATP-binding protein [Ferrimicrobium sp.]|jgi:type IV secretory pathway VirB4 component|nr:ATP-binding protein [Ferrimicrobium sp.]